MNFINKFKQSMLRRIISSPFFWKIRHIVQSSWIIDYSSKDTKFFEQIIKDYNINSVLDFGCASGATLLNLKRMQNQLIVYGVDINERAIKYSREKFDEEFDDGYEFNNSLEIGRIDKFFSSHSSTIDLLIFDRVLYCLNQQGVNEILDELACRSKYIFIDDFYVSDEIKTIGYVHRDWDKILSDFGFEPIYQSKTIYSSVLNANPRTVLYKNKAV